MKRIEIISVFAIGLSLIVWSQLMYQDTREQARKIADSKPIQIPIERNIFQITKDFYSEVDAPHEVILLSSSSENNHQIGKASILIKIAKAEVFTDNEKINAFKSDKICRERHSACKITHFRSVAKRKHTITISIEDVNPKLYALNPKIRIDISPMYRAKGLRNNFIAIIVTMLLGVAILLILIFGLAQEFITKKYISI